MGSIWRDPPGDCKPGDAAVHDHAVPGGIFGPGADRDSISGIEETYRGTRVFRACKLQDVFRDKVVHYTGPMTAAWACRKATFPCRENDQLDLSGEDWFAYADHYGTSEEKAFVASLFPVRRPVSKGL